MGDVRVKLGGGKTRGTRWGKQETQKRNKWGSGRGTQRNKDKEQMAENKINQTKKNEIKMDR